MKHNPVSEVVDLLQSVWKMVVFWLLILEHGDHGLRLCDDPGPTPPVRFCNWTFRF